MQCTHAGLILTILLLKHECPETNIFYYINNNKKKKH